MEVVYVLKALALVYIIYRIAKWMSDRFDKKQTQRR